MSDEELDSLKSDLGIVISFIKNSDDKNRISESVKYNVSIQTVFEMI